MLGKSLEAASGKIAQQFLELPYLSIPFPGLTCEKLWSRGRALWKGQHINNQLLERKSLEWSFPGGNLEIAQPVFASNLSRRLSSFSREDFCQMLFNVAP
jgi:hypothetical protein